MENNEIMMEEVVEETVEETSKKINPATGIVAGLAIVGTYYVVTKAVEFTKDTVKKVKAFKASKTNSEETSEVVEDYFEEV